MVPLTFKPRWTRLLSSTRQQKNKPCCGASRLGFSPLRPSAAGALYDSEPFHKPVIDPYPNSVVIVGEDYDIRGKGYQINHNVDGATRVYETEAGSGEYFIVDIIGGDGVGSSALQDSASLLASKFIKVVP